MQGSFIQGFAYSTQSLFESWFEKLSLSAGIGAVVGFFRIDIVLVYAMFAMMTADYVLGLDGREESGDMGYSGCAAWVHKVRILFPMGSLGLRGQYDVIQGFPV